MRKVDMMFAVISCFVRLISVFLGFKNPKGEATPPVRKKPPPGPPPWIKGDYVAPVPEKKPYEPQAVHHYPSPHAALPEKFRSFLDCEHLRPIGQRRWNMLMDPNRQTVHFTDDGKLDHLELCGSAMWARIAVDDAIVSGESVQGQCPRFWNLCGVKNCAVPEHTVLDFPYFNPIPDSKYPVAVNGVLQDMASDALVEDDAPAQAISDPAPGVVDASQVRQCECGECAKAREKLMGEGVYGREKLKHMLDCVAVRVIRERGNGVLMPQEYRSTCGYAKIPYLSERAARLSFELSNRKSSYTGAYVCPDPMCGAVHTTRQRQQR